MRNSSKGLGAIAFFLIIGLLAVVSTWIFFTFFKVQVIGIAVDVNSINRYQEIPTTVLADVLYFEDGNKATVDGKTPDTRPKGGINCFQGDGPAGAHEVVADRNRVVCTKPAAFFFEKYANKEAYSNSDTKSTNSNNNPKSDVLLLSDQIMNNPSTEAVNFKNNLFASFPVGCFKLLFTFDKKQISDGGVMQPLTQCNLDQPKLNENYPIPIFTNEPNVGAQVLKIGNSVTNGESLLLTWPKYGTKFEFGGS